MIVVESVLIPHGDPSKGMERLCRLHIINDGTGTHRRGNYDVQLYSRGDKPKLIREARIEGFDRKELAAWRLIAKAFEVLS